VKDTDTTSDACDRCGRIARIHIGWGSETGFDGLCDECLNTRTKWNTPPFEVVPFEVMCEWFAMCANMTSDAASHPIMGPVPICSRCASKMEITPGFTITGPYNVVAK